MRTLLALPLQYLPKPMERAVSEQLDVIWLGAVVIVKEGGAVQ